MFKNGYTAEEPAEHLAADNDPDGNDLESSSEDDLSSIDEDKNQQFYQTLTLMILNLA